MRLGPCHRPAFFQLVFQPLIFVKTILLIAACHPSELNNWYLFSTQHVIVGLRKMRVKLTGVIANCGVMHFVHTRLHLRKMSLFWDPNLVVLERPGWPDSFRDVLVPDGGKHGLGGRLHLVQAGAVNHCNGHLKMCDLDRELSAYTIQLVFSVRSVSSIICFIQFNPYCRYHL